MEKEGTVTDTIYGVIVLAVSFAGAVIGTIVLFVGMGIRDALDLSLIHISEPTRPY